MKQAIDGLTRGRQTEETYVEGQDRAYRGINRASDNNMDNHRQHMLQTFGNNDTKRACPVSKECLPVGDAPSWSAMLQSHLVTDGYVW